MVRNARHPPGVPDRPRAPRVPGPVQPRPADPICRATNATDRRGAISRRLLRILTVNAGSSSVKSALYEMDGTAETRRLAARLTGIGTGGGRFRVTDAAGAELVARDAGLPDHAAAIGAFLDWLAESGAAGAIDAVGHRLVHGGLSFGAPAQITPEMERALEGLASLDPDHLPAELAAIRATGRAFPDTIQVACFDTAFHHDLPAVARMLPLTRALYDEGVVRFGFHGLSYQYVLGALEAAGGAAAARGRVVIAHLGAGASLAAVRDGRPVDTTMGFTPAGGLMMATRSGDLDPGVLIHLAREKGFSPDDLDALVNRRAGLAGMSGTTGDMAALMRAAPEDARAAEAVALFCYTARKQLAAMAAALGGLDTVVFTAGIGERAPSVRQAICDGLGFLGIAIDAAANAGNAPVISAAQSRVTVRVIPTDEEIVIARATEDLARPLADPTFEGHV